MSWCLSPINVTSCCPKQFYLCLIWGEPQHIVLDEANEDLVVELDDVTPCAHRSITVVVLALQEILG